MKKSTKKILEEATPLNSNTAFYGLRSERVRASVRGSLGATRTEGYPTFGIAVLYSSSHLAKRTVLGHFNRCLRGEVAVSERGVTALRCISPYSIVLRLRLVHTQQYDPVKGPRPRSRATCVNNVGWSRNRSCSDRRDIDSYR